MLRLSLPITAQILSTLQRDIDSNENLGRSYRNHGLLHRAILKATSIGLS
jgi:hypothetical protein